MNNEVIERGNTTYLGTNIVHADLIVTGVGAQYTIRIGDGPTIEHNIKPVSANYHAINNAAVSITNTTPHGGPDSLLISWHQ